MNGSEQPPISLPDVRVRAAYEEYDLDDVRVGMIADPENEHAWVQSDRTVDVTR